MANVTYNHSTDNLLASPNTKLSQVLIIGAAGGIGQALCQQYLQYPDINITTLSHTPLPQPLALNRRIHSIKCNWQASELATALQQCQTHGLFDRAIICTGILQSQDTTAEKRLEHLSADNLNKLFYANSVIPVLCLQQLPWLLTPRAAIAILTARVGSITDNHLGGWYSYRASKAALNMLIKTAAIEYARRWPGLRMLAYHPGTVDTKLSKPFQHNIAPQQLRTTAQTAQHLCQLLGTLHHRPLTDAPLPFLDWQEESIPW